MRNTKVTKNYAYGNDDHGKPLGLQPEDAPDDPRFARPQSNVGHTFRDPEEPDRELTVIWDGAYRDATNWGYSRGLISVSENDRGDGRNVFHPEEGSLEWQEAVARRQKPVVHPAEEEERRAAA